MLKTQQPANSRPVYFQAVMFGPTIALLFFRYVGKPRMTLKIETESARGKTIVRLSGRLRSEHLDELKLQVTGNASEIALDLEAVMLVDVEVIRFLNSCEQSGVELLHCCPYIREWMNREKAAKR